MIERRVMQLLPTAGLAVACATLGLAWVAEPSFAPAGWQGRLLVLLGGIALMLLVVRFGLVRSSKTAESTRRYIDRLCELQAAELDDETAFDSIPLRQGDQCWRELCQRVRRRLAEFARRAEELEMARAGAEVRTHRALTERQQLH